MSSYFVNSISSCYGQSGLETCSDGHFERNGSYHTSPGVYSSFAGGRYPYGSRADRIVEHQTPDFYTAPRLTHLPASSPCSSPPNINGGVHNQQGPPQSQNAVTLNSRERSCEMRNPTPSGGGGYFPNGQITNSVEDTRPPSAHSNSPPQTKPQTSPPRSTPHPPRQQSHPPSPNRDDSNYSTPHIYPWMRRMQYSAGE